MSVSIPSNIFVPMPSVPDTNKGSSYPQFLRSKIPPNPPILSKFPFLFVDLLSSEISSTRASVFSISTHLLLYMLSYLISFKRIVNE